MSERHQCDINTLYEHYLKQLRDDIEEKQKQIRLIDEEISELGLCWFGKKRRYKKSLKSKRQRLF